SAPLDCSTFRRLSHARGRLFLGLAFKFLSLELFVMVYQTSKIVAVLLGYPLPRGSHLFDCLVFNHIALLEVRVVR
ncbi:MAG: hypothetical protein ACKOD5_04735, partial [Chthoniobacterales bacterium]